jgi:hypothetical protein
LWTFCRGGFGGVRTGGSRWGSEGPAGPAGQRARERHEVGGGVRSSAVASLQGASALALGTSTSREPEEEDESKTKSVRLPTWSRGGD